jgi:PAS domain S-box-containing protein
MLIVDGEYLMFPDYRLRQREYLLQITRAMTARLDLPSLLKLILESAVEILSGQVGLIVLRREDGSFYPRVSYGLAVQTIQLLDPLWRDLPRTASSQQWQMPDLTARLRLASAAVGVPLRQVVALPMTIRDEVIGIIYVIRSLGTDFTANDQQLLGDFADQAAITVQNARLYQQIEDERERLTAIIENSGDGVMILDPDRTIRTWNRALVGVTGVTAEDAIGQHCYDVLDLKNRQDVSVCRTACPLVNPPPDARLYAEGDTRRADGVKVSLADNYSPQHDREGNIVRVIANVRDVSRLRDAEEMKNTLLSVISHELKTPVSIIKGYAGTLGRQDADWDKETLTDGLAVIEEEADKLNELINNLLDASRLQAGGLKLQFAYLDLPSMAEKAVQKLRLQTQRHSFSLDFPPDLPPLQGDYERIREVLSNLLGNAIKYSPDGGLIRVGGRVRDNEVVISVSDEGVGIPVSEQERIFERFSRVDSSLTRQTPGAGLGLFLVKSVIEAHGGRVWVESQPGRGATFYFTLPTNRPATDAKMGTT